MIQYITAFLTGLLTLQSAISDITAKKIRNEVFVIGVLSGFLLSGIKDGYSGLFSSLCGMVVPIIIFLPFCTNKISFMGMRSIKIMGMGDLKLFGFTGALVGLEAIFSVLLFTYIFGGLYSLIYMISKKILIKRIKYFFFWLTDIFVQKKVSEYISAERIRFAPFVFCGVCAHYLRILCL